MSATAQELCFRTDSIMPHQGQPTYPGMPTFGPPTGIHETTAICGRYRIRPMIQVETVPSNGAWNFYGNAEVIFKCCGLSFKYECNRALVEQQLTHVHRNPAVVNCQPAYQVMVNLGERQTFDTAMTEFARAWCRVWPYSVAQNKVDRDYLAFIKQMLYTTRVNSKVTTGAPRAEGQTDCSCCVEAKVHGNFVQFIQHRPTLCGTDWMCTCIIREICQPRRRFEQETIRKLIAPIASFHKSNTECHQEVLNKIFKAYTTALLAHEAPLPSFMAGIFCD